MATPEIALIEAPLVPSLGISLEGPPSGEGPEGTTLIEAHLVSSLGISVGGSPTGEGSTSMQGQWPYTDPAPCRLHHRNSNG